VVLVAKTISRLPVEAKVLVRDAGRSQGSGCSA
jgi:hypothetical protein